MTNEMTAEEAIRWLDAIKKYYIHGGDEAYDKKRMKAIDKAIKALEQQPTDAVSRSELQKTMDSLPLFRFVNNDHEEADDYYNCESVDMVIRNLPSVTPKYTDEEIDKAQAVEQAYVDKMVELAVAESKRPKGKWIEVLEHRDEFGSTWHYECSECRGRSYKGFEPLEKYCPNCGAEMGGADETN